MGLLGILVSVGVLAGSCSVTDAGPFPPGHVFTSVCTVRCEACGRPLIVSAEACRLDSRSAHYEMEANCDSPCYDAACGASKSCTCEDPIDTGVECEREGTGAGLHDAGE